MLPKQSCDPQICWSNSLHLCICTTPLILLSSSARPKQYAVQASGTVSAAQASTADKTELLCCGKPCHKALPKCPHVCQARCHQGPCPAGSGGVCQEEVTVRCSCRRCKAKMPCHQVCLCPPTCPAALQHALQDALPPGLCLPSKVPCHQFCVCPLQSALPPGLCLPSKVPCHQVCLCSLRCHATRSSVGMVTSQRGGGGGGGKKKKKKNP